MTKGEVMLVGKMRNVCKGERPGMGWRWPQGLGFGGGRLPIKLSPDLKTGSLIRKISGVIVSIVLPRAFPPQPPSPISPMKRILFTLTCLSIQPMHTAPVPLSSLSPPSTIATTAAPIRTLLASKASLRCRNYGDCGTVTPSSETAQKRTRPRTGQRAAPWEFPPEREIRAESFILERVREDSTYEMATFDRTYQLKQLNFEMRKTLCDPPATGEKKSSCALYWQKCTTCSAAWYYTWWTKNNQLFSRAVFANGYGKVVPSVTPAVEVSKYKVDILVPYACRPEKLIDFADRVSELRDLTYIRIILTNFHCPKEVQYMPTADLKSLLVEFIGFKRKNAVIVIDSKNKHDKFSRAKALNMLHHACDAASMVVAMDIDMQFDVGFLNRIRSFVNPGISMYFPIVWSTFNPTNVDKLAAFFAVPRESLSADYRGIWRNFGYGIYAMYGEDAKKYALSESFTTWGGEDNDFFGRMKTKLHIIRARDAGLIHLWHKESCDATKPSCTGSKARLEGPPLVFMINK